MYEVTITGITGLVVTIPSESIGETLNRVEYHLTSVFTESVTVRNVG